MREFGIDLNQVKLQQQIVDMLKDSFNYLAHLVNGSKEIINVLPHDLEDQRSIQHTQRIGLQSKSIS